MRYMDRANDALLERLLRLMGGIVLEGPRACGKTSTGLHHAASSVRLDRPEARQLAELDPDAVLAGATPRLIDEWQLAPDLWNVIRHEIDTRQAPGQFILSGSAAPSDDVPRHSGAGRMIRVRMRPMALAESGRSSMQVSLSELPNIARLSNVRSPLTYRDLAGEAIRGGWPALIDMDTGSSREFTASYMSDIASTDIPLATGTRHDPSRVARLLSSIARTVATEAGAAKLAADISADGGSLDVNTVRNYLDALARIFVIEEQPAWSPSLRSRTRLRQQPRMHFTDPSLACAALRLTPERLAQDPEYFGQVFESMVVRDIRSYLSATGGSVFHYRDGTNLEVDLILELADGGWAAIEVKLGASMVPEAEKNLLKLRDERIDTSTLGDPAFLAIITGTEHGYTLPSGVHVIPLGALTW